MTFTGIKSQNGLETIGLSNTLHQYWNLEPTVLTEHTLANDQGVLADSGALCVDTGEFTGRSPKDKFCVEDDLTRDTVWWGEINQPISQEDYQALKTKVLAYLQSRDLYVRDVYAGADPNYRLNVRVVNTKPWPNMFVYNMFIEPSQSELKTFEPEWTIIQAPEFHAEGAADGIRQHNFSIINFTE
ncbi:MAG: phosphoenolpyruvate carboxykinase (ATP), partial [Bacteroidota bacterium]